MTALPTNAHLSTAIAAEDAPPETLELPPEVDTPVLHQALAEAAAGSAGAYDKAVRIQEWLRRAGGFTYSLDLEPPPEGMNETTVRRTALDRFLTSRRGYCVQFATAMVMLARAAEIPARLVSGFRPGRVEGENRIVLSSDAHAWPELRFEGLGWLRFEPTPAARDVFPPTYAWNRAEEVVPPITSAASPSPESPVVSPTPSASVPATGVMKSDGSVNSRKHRWWFWVIGAVTAIGIGGIRTFPAAWSRWHRRRRLSPGCEVGVEWDIMSERLRDLGILVPVSASPRALHRELKAHIPLNSPAQDALSRMALAVELFRYAPSDDKRVHDVGVARTFRSDAGLIVDEAARHRTKTDRLRAALWPTPGPLLPGEWRSRPRRFRSG
ncbi:transglutaminase-like domain-containing protein [Austwickia chelonae]|uniref:transglutaminase-like domain-containing protein n=1 Tax=Austwickia chelonae TaxID=100225 RepID=UPI0013C31622|nr:transglutaminase-like domain-containing protein [Austwickia chelonae]